MGIRINKVLGYGLTDIKIENNNIIDSRLNTKGYLLSDNTKKWSIKGFNSFWEKNHTDRFDYHLFNYLSFDKIEIDMCICYNPEFDSNPIVVITPISQLNDWYRHDDIIDYQEEIYNHSIEDRYQIYDFGIYPWTGSFCNKKGEIWKKGQDGFPNQSIAHEFIRVKTNNQLDKYKKESQLSYFAEILGFDSVDEAKENIIPIIPEEIQMLCKYLNLFNDEQTIYELRPMLYVFWR